MQYIQKTGMAIQNNSTSIRNHEVQIDQLSSMLIKRIAGTLPSNTVTNPKEHVKAISLRSGRTYEEPKVTDAKEDEAMDNEESEMKEVEQAERLGRMKELQNPKDPRKILLRLSFLQFMIHQFLFRKD